jgi:hypothetical protein
MKETYREEPTLKTKHIHWIEEVISLQTCMTENIHISPKYVPLKFSLTWEGILFWIPMDLGLNGDSLTCDQACCLAPSSISYYV